MHKELLPEAIRGAWYFIPDTISSPAAPQGQLSRETLLTHHGQLLALDIDGEFRRYELQSDGQKLEKVEKEAGDYVFDGDFLILRARATETFRLQIEAAWCWGLESQKKRWRMVRGLLGARDFFDVDADERRAIDTSSLRVEVVNPFGDERDAIYELVFNPPGDEPLALATFSVDLDAELDELWVGLTPRVTNLSADTWQKLITQSYLNLYRASLTPPARILLEIIGTEQVRRFALST